MQLIQGDCHEALITINDCSVDLVLTDPPYNIAQDNNFSSMGRAGIDFGEWDKDADILSFIPMAARILKKGGGLIVFNDWKNLGDIVKEAERSGLQTKDMIRLEKTNPMPRNRERRYVTDFECAIWFVKPGAKWVFNRQDPAYQRPKFVKSVEKGLHPTQKNLSLMEDLIKIHSNTGDTVLDCFMGSGTTGLACMNLGRRFIGIERDSHYFKVASERLRA
jgi:site-specific DNA-methyltransferase (adenine-specific)